MQTGFMFPAPSWSPLHFNDFSVNSEITSDEAQVWHPEESGVHEGNTGHRARPSHVGQKQT